MNIHLPAILGFTRYQGFDPSPFVAVGFLTSNQVDILHETSEILEAGLSVLHLILCGAGISFVSFCINNDYN